MEERGSGGSKGGREGRTPPPPLGVQILSISCSFLGEFGKIVCSRPPWRVHAPPLGEILDPSLRGEHVTSAPSKLNCHVRYLLINIHKALSQTHHSAPYILY